jgi:peptidoglycan hydrolase CwlO-like protein
MATESEILGDIQQIYRKVDQCYRSKEDLAAHIAKEQAGIVELELLMKADGERVDSGKRPRYDSASMLANIERLVDNIHLFQATIKREDENIATFHKVVKVLQEDMARPTELIIDASPAR